MSTVSHINSETSSIRINKYAADSRILGSVINTWEEQFLEGDLPGATWIICRVDSDVFVFLSSPTSLELPWSSVSPSYTNGYEAAVAAVFMAKIISSSCSLQRTF